MVANHVQQVQRKRVASVLVKLKVDSKSGLVTNIREWNEKLEEGFSTSSMRMFLDESYGIEVPKELEILSIHQLGVEKQVLRTKNRITKEKNFIKIEPDTQPTSTEINISAGTSSSTSTSSGSTSSESESTDSSSVSSSSVSDVIESKKPISHGDEQKMNNMEEVIRENAKRMLEKEEKRRKEKMIRGDKSSTTLYINPLTVVPPSLSHINPFATIKLEVDGEVKMCELESEEVRGERMDAWSLVKDTLGAISKSVWRHVSAGNVYDLIATVNRHFDVEERGDVVSSLLSELDEFAFVENELFKTFVVRFKELIFKMEQVSLVRDVDAMRARLRRLLASAHAPVSTIFSNFLMITPKADFDEMSCVEILERIEPLVTEKEREVRKEKESERKKEKSEKRKEKKLRKKKEKEEQEQEQDQVAQAQALAAKTQKRKANPVERKQAGVEEVKGVCLHFQRDRCIMPGTCKFLHKKLSSEQVKLLEEFVAKGKKNKPKASSAEGVVCFACGETGHYASSCPTAAGAAASAADQASRFTGRSRVQSDLSVEEQMKALMAKFGAKKVLELSMCLSDAKAGAEAKNEAAGQK